MLVFVDTNVFVYARDRDSPNKQILAAAWLDHLWQNDQGRTSSQVLQELYSVATSKLGQPPGDARADVRDLLAWSPVMIDPSILEAAWAFQDRFNISFWDSLIVAAAHRTRSEILLTEDLQHGMDLDGIKVVDPFEVAPGDL